MTVSLILPVHKSDEWLPQCLESIRAQTYKDIQLIRIDDPQGSGPAAARNRGLDKATGDFIAFVDADDYLEPNAIEVMVKAIDGVDMVAGSFRKFGSFKMVVQHETKVFRPDEVADYVMENLRNPRQHQMLSGCWAKLYRRLLTERFPLLTTAEDMAFNFDYLARCNSVRFISDIVYNNRKHNGSVTTTFDENNKPGLFGFLEGLRYVDYFLKDFYFEEERSLAIDNSKVYHSALYFMRICEQTGLPMNEVFKRLYP